MAKHQIMINGINQKYRKMINGINQKARKIKTPETKNLLQTPTGPPADTVGFCRIETCQRPPDFGVSSVERRQTGSDEKAGNNKRTELQIPPTG